MSYRYILLDIHEAERFALITLNRPEVLNALNDALIDELVDALQMLDADDRLNSIVLTGSDKSFAAGADIAEMRDLTYAEAQRSNFIGRNWDRIAAVRKPVIAAVRGFALGGGCELVMLCDLVIAAENAKFGQPEIKLGIMPGAGGTQRLPRAVGKAKAMDLCLTGRLWSAEEAEKSGLVSRVVADERCLPEALAVAAQLGKMSLPSLLSVKQAIGGAFESPLRTGLAYERAMFYGCFATDDQKEGMQAFIDKRKADFQHR
ncbi:MAG: enoyl-CoA hydratase-related protein [Burkholderiaceae bacterium]|jgi:enoyl-CoA hydratase